MRLVEGPFPYPHSACAVTGREDGELIDFHRIIDSPHPTRLHLKREIVEEAGRLCGMVSGAEVEAVKGQLEAVSTRLKEVEEQMETYAEFEEKFRNKELTPA